MLNAPLTRLMNLPDEQLRKAQSNLIPRLEIKHLASSVSGTFIVQTLVGVQINEQKKVEHLIFTVDRSYSREGERYTDRLKPVESFVLTYVPVGLLTKFIRGAALLNNAECERGGFHKDVKGIYVRPDVKDCRRVITNLVITPDGDLFFPYGAAIYGPYATEIVSHRLDSVSNMDTIVYAGKETRGIMSASAAEMTTPITAYDTLNSRRHMASQANIGANPTRKYHDDDYMTEYYHLAESATIAEKLFVGDRFGSKDSSTFIVSAGELFTYLAKSHILAGPITTNVAGIFSFLPAMHLLPTVEEIIVHDCVTESMVLQPIWALPASRYSGSRFTVQLNKCKIGSLSFMPAAEGVAVNASPYSLNVQHCEIDNFSNPTAFRNLHINGSVVHSMSGFTDRNKSISYNGL